ncbi:MAG: hypothetical protein ABL890_00800 [Candidatus Peribacteraceae bacterium]
MLDKTFFAGHLDDDEVIVIVVHKHWLMGLKVLWLPTLVFLLVGSIVYFVRAKAILYGIALAEAGVLLWWTRNFLDYFLDAWIVTNAGVVDLEWHGWFHRSATRVLYSDVQGVSYEVSGIMATVWNYGSMTLEKISTGTSLTMPYVKRPKRITAIILKCMETYVHSKNLKDATTVQKILAEFVAGTLQKKDLVGDEE